jgi:hypothetical protein
MKQQRVHTGSSVQFSPVLWVQVIALAGMLAAILFSFMVYGVYQPFLLNRLGFPGLARDWPIYQGFLGVMVEPALGRLSDKILTRTGSRLPQITVGVTIAGGAFVILAVLLPYDLNGVLSWLFLGLMTVWLIAMIAIRGPIVALLKQLAPTEQLPSANRLIILVLALVSALFALLAGQLQTQAGTIAFLLGAIALMTTATLLYRLTTQVLQTRPPVADKGLVPHYRLHRRLLVGIVTGFLLQLLRMVLSINLYPTLPQVSPDQLTALTLLIAALTANPWGWWVSRWGATQGLQVGLAATVGLCWLLSWQVVPPAAMVLLITAGAIMGLILICLGPFALSDIPLSLSGLSTGLLFGGYGLGIAIEMLCHRALSDRSLWVMAGIGAIAGVIAFHLPPQKLPRNTA